jgi:hypothetical protein
MRNSTKRAEPSNSSSAPRVILAPSAGSFVVFATQDNKELLADET